MLLPAVRPCIALALCTTPPPPLPRTSLVQAVSRELTARRDKLLAELADVDRALQAEAAYERDAYEEAEQVMLPIALGSRTSAFEPTFGYLSRSAGVYTEATAADGTNLPTSAFDLATKNFGRELSELTRAVSGSDEASYAPDADCSPEAAAVRAKLDSLVLSNDAVWERERRREAAGNKVDSPLVLLVPYYVLCWCLDVFFEDRPLARFWFLETVARMPYFAYVSALHLYETLGWWRRSAETRRVHFAEEWNEFHHLLTMEALGGDQRWADRFLAQHAAILYYWLLVALWLVSPSLSYNFSELIEAHAVDTYGEFVDANRATLAELPAPSVSRRYYNGPDLFLFDEFQTSRARGSRRPPCDTLLDVFEAIRDDEGEHVATMRACQDPSAVVAAPRVERSLLLLGAAAIVTVGLAASPEDLGADGLGEVAVDVAEVGLAGLVSDGLLPAGKSLLTAGRALFTGLPKVGEAMPSLEALPSLREALAAAADGTREALEVLVERLSGGPK